MKKVLKGKPIKQKGGIESGSVFNKDSLTKIMSSQLSEETDYLGGIVISNKFRSPAQKYLRDLDEMIGTSPNVNKTIDCHHKKSDLVSIPDSDYKNRKNKELRKYSYSETPKNGLTIDQAEREKIPFLQVYPSQVKIRSTGRLG